MDRRPGQQQQPQPQQPPDQQGEEYHNRFINLARRFIQRPFLAIRMADNNDDDDENGLFLDNDDNVHFFGNVDEDDDDADAEWLADDFSDEDMDDDDIEFHNRIIAVDSEDDDDDLDINNGNNDDNRMDQNEEESRNENETNYDISLPVEHSYLGGLDSVDSARCLFTPGSIVALKTLYLNGMYLIPGQEIPLTFSNRITLQFITAIIEHDDSRTFGIRIGRFEDRFGTTAEIRSYSFKDDRSSITIKVQGRQRFIIVKDFNNEQGEYQPNVRILPEINMHDFFRPIVQSEYRLSRKSRTLITPLPANSLNQYDNNVLMERLKSVLMRIFEYRIKNDEFSYPVDAIAFSYFVLMTIPFPDAIKTHLLKIDCVNLRLWLEMSLLNENFKFICGTCRQNLCDRNSFLVMSKLGTSGTFVNSNGFVHELYTFSKVENARRVSSYSEDFSWFPNYGWIIIKSVIIINAINKFLSKKFSFFLIFKSCRRCRTHLGWEFETRKPNIVPKKFWALTK